MEFEGIIIEETKPTKRGTWDTDGIKNYVTKLQNIGKVANLLAQGKTKEAEEVAKKLGVNLELAKKLTAEKKKIMAISIPVEHFLKYWNGTGDEKYNGVRVKKVLDSIYGKGFSSVVTKTVAGKETTYISIPII